MRCPRELKPLLVGLALLGAVLLPVWPHPSHQAPEGVLDFHPHCSRNAPGHFDPRPVPHPLDCWLCQVQTASSTFEAVAFFEVFRQGAGRTPLGFSTFPAARSAAVRPSDRAPPRILPSPVNRH